MGLGMGVLRLEERHCDVVGVVAALLKGRGPVRGLLFPLVSIQPGASFHWLPAQLFLCPTVTPKASHVVFSPFVPHGSTLLLKKKQKQFRGYIVPELLLRPGSALGASVRLSQHVAATTVTALLSHKNFDGTFFSSWGPSVYGLNAGACCGSDVGVIVILCAREKVKLCIVSQLPWLLFCFAPRLQILL